MKNYFEIITNIIQKSLKNKLFRFFMVSGLNSTFGYGLFALLIYIGFAYPYALLIGTVVGILFNFKTIGSLVFKNNNNILIFNFFGVYGITFLGNLGGLALFTHFGFSEYIGGAFLLIPMGIIAYLLNKYFVFSSRNSLKQ